MLITTGMFSHLPYIYYDDRISHDHYVSSVRFLHNGQCSEFIVNTFDGGLIIDGASIYGPTQMKMSIYEKTKYTPNPFMVSVIG